MHVTNCILYLIHVHNSWIVINIFFNFCTLCSLCLQYLLVLLRNLPLFLLSLLLNVPVKGPGELVIWSLNLHNYHTKTIYNVHVARQHVQKNWKSKLIKYYVLQKVEIELHVKKNFKDTWVKLAKPRTFRAANIHKFQNRKIKGQRN